MAYNNQYPAHIKEEANKLLRVFLWIFGPILLVQGYLDTQGITAEHGFIYPIFLGIVSAVFVAYYIIFRKKFGKALKKDKKKEINKPL